MKCNKTFLDVTHVVVEQDVGQGVDDLKQTGDTDPDNHPLELTKLKT